MACGREQPPRVPATRRFGFPERVRVKATPPSPAKQPPQQQQAGAEVGVAGAEQAPQQAQQPAKQPGVPGEPAAMGQPAVAAAAGQPAAAAVHAAPAAAWPKLVSQEVSTAPGAALLLQHLPPCLASQPGALAGGARATVAFFDALACLPMPAPPCPPFLPEQEWRSLLKKLPDLINKTLEALAQPQAAPPLPGWGPHAAAAAVAGC